MKWLYETSESLGVDRSRIAIAGQSAGGGLAAALTQRLSDKAWLTPAFQLLVYPMLDARTTARADHRGTGKFIWTPKSNLYGWRSYLGFDPGAGPYPPYSVPAQHLDLTGLPPTWIGVGDLDLFHEENLEYARRLKRDGVACELHVSPGAYHAFDVFHPQSRPARDFQASIVSALKGAFFPEA